MLVQKTGARVGLLNPNLYSIASISANALHDITTGNNDQICLGGSPNCPALTSTTTGQMGYNAGPGYDQTTGWGSLDAYNFVEQFSGDIQLTANPTSITLTPGNSATATITVAPQNNFTGNVTFTCAVSSGLIGVTCSIPGTVTTSGAATLTITAGSNAASPTLRFFKQIPPIQPEWPLGSVMLIGLLYLSWRKRTKWIGVMKAKPAYVFGAAALCAISLVAVSCGGGSSSGSGGSSTTPTTLALACTVTPNAQQGVAYSSGCTATGGTSPYTYTISSGTLPSGLSLNSSTGAITGTPTGVGTVTFTVKAADSGSPQQTATQSETITVAPEAGTVTVTATSGMITNTAQVAVSVQ
jgi:hypothetical protein